MSKQACSNCPTLAKIIQQQRAEIAVLRKIIAEAKNTCNQIAAESGRVMTQHGSPYKYNLAKGARDAALNIDRQLR